MNIFSTQFNDNDFHFVDNDVFGNNNLVSITLDDLSVFKVLHDLDISKASGSNPFNSHIV